jgi:hypothetical protein
MGEERGLTGLVEIVRQKIIASEAAYVRMRFAKCPALPLPIGLRSMRMGAPSLRESLGPFG